MTVLDTNVVSELVRRNTESRRRSELGELAEEFLASSSAGRLPALDQSGASRAASFRAEPQKAGRPVAVPDPLIAGIALRHGAALATRNVGDFDGAGLDIIDSWQGGSA